MLAGANCVKCGKEFYPTPMHVFRDWRGLYCCWTCYNHRNDGCEQKIMTKQVEQWSLDGELIKIFRSASEAAEAIDVAYSTMTKVCKQARSESSLLYTFRGYMWRYRE